MDKRDRFLEVGGYDLGHVVAALEQIGNFSSETVGGDEPLMSRQLEILRLGLQIPLVRFVQRDDGVFRKTGNILEPPDTLLGPAIKFG